MLGLPRQEKDSTRRPAPRLEQLESRDTPTMFAIGDIYNAQVGRVLNVPFKDGLTSNDFSDQSTAPITATLVPNSVKYVGNARPLPVPSVFLNLDGSFTFVAPAANLVPSGVTQVQFNYVASNPSGETAIGTATINLQTDPVKLVATGADAGAGPHVRVFDAGTGQVRYNFFPYETTFTGGVRVAVGDVNNDGTPDILTIPASGGAPRLRVFSGTDGAPLIDTFAFDSNFRGGAYIAVGDVNGDKQPDIILGAGDGGGPRVQVFSYNNKTGALSTLADFFAYEPSIQSGVKVAAGDLTASGRAQIITAPGTGGGVQVKGFDLFKDLFNTPPGQVGAGTGGFRNSQPPTPSISFLGTDASNTTGVNITTGNFRGDGKADIVVGTASGNGIVRVFDGRSGGLLRELAAPTDNYPDGATTQTGTGTFSGQTPPSGTLLAPSIVPGALAPSSPGRTTAGTVQGGVRVATVDWNKDGIDDIVTANGAGNVSRVRIFNGRDSTSIIDFLAYDSSFLGGVNVAAK